jgi:hypothetical protein
MYTDLHQHDIHDVGSLTLADPPHASRPRYPWQKTGVDMMHKAREKIEGSLNIDEMGMFPSPTSLPVD